jgi:hypothetical protein
MHDHIALTRLLTERSTGKIAAYMSLIMDAIKLSFTEKELHNLKYPFKTIPAMKIAKLAVDYRFSEKYKGIGTFMVDSAERLAWACNTAYCATRFLTVDAVLSFMRMTMKNRLFRSTRTATHALLWRERTVSTSQ